MNKEDFIEEAIDELASEYVGKNLHLSESTFLEDERDHVKMILASAIRTKWSLGVPGGGFINHLVNNNLEGAVTMADQINRKAIVVLVCGLLYITLTEIMDRSIVLQAKDIKKKEEEAS